MDLNGYTVSGVVVRIETPIYLHLSQDDILHLCLIFFGKSNYKQSFIDT